VVANVVEVTDAWMKQLTAEVQVAECSGMPKAVTQKSTWGRGNIWKPGRRRSDQQCGEIWGLRTAEVLLLLLLLLFLLMMMTTTKTLKWILLVLALYRIYLVKGQLSLFISFN
jgi:hypothetical protein